MEPVLIECAHLFHHHRNERSRMYLEKDEDWQCYHLGQMVSVFFTEKKLIFGDIT